MISVFFLKLKKNTPPLISPFSKEWKRKETSSLVSMFTMSLLKLKQRNFFFLFLCCHDINISNATNDLMICILDVVITFMTDKLVDKIERIEQ